MYSHIIVFICALSLVIANDDSGDEVTPDYGFVAYLFSKQNTSIRCTGAIVALSWILDYCEYGDYEYDAIRVGVRQKLNRVNRIDYIYDIDNRISYPGHHITQYPQNNNDYDLSALYASKHSLFLDHTSREMKLIAGIVRPIIVSRTTRLLKKAKTIFFSQAEKDAHYKVLPIINTSKCNRYFQRYSLYVEKDSQFCVDSSSVTFNECCASHAIMESGNHLIGVVAWSTACWSPPEPWVFTNMGSYYEWIVNITSYDPIFYARLEKHIKIK